MKRYVLHLCMLSFLFLFGMGVSQAQTDGSSKSVITKMKDATKEFESTVKSLEAKRKSGEIDQEQFEDAMEEAADAFEDKMETLGEAIGDMFDDDDDDDHSVSIQTDSSRNKVKISLGDKEEKKRTNSYFLLNFGPTYMMEGTISDNVETPDFSPWKSWSGNFGLVFSTRIGGENSIAYVNYGLLWKYTYVEVSSDHRLVVEDGNPYYVPPSPYASSLDKSEFSRHALVLPVQLRFAGSSKKSLNVMLGGYGGLRLYAFQDLEFKSMDGEDAELRLRNDYQTNMLMYGVSAAIGQRWWQLYADYELSNLFEDNPNYEYNMLNAGIQFFF
ncbi:MAG: outer membrane beta-barrel protein [Saprospiraceae bacterium]|nr:outer membrane beta-barrel protein [Saprospiraceae bacterium]